mmetsp:Transcript_1925/g.2925  ORF Transcript_1925/g.2925 Transcript_1925/m.2925 type:complete len:463 (-) Transcript_1925:490-1878(-)
MNSSPPNDATFEAGGGGGVRVHSKEKTVGARQSGKPDLEVTRYVLNWNRIGTGELPIIRTEMVIHFSVSNGAMYGKGFKSIATSTVTDILVRDDLTGKVLRHETFERDGFQFVQWWFTEVMTSAAQIMITYDIHDGVEGCSTNAYCSSYRCYSSEGADYDESYDGILNPSCSESFSAPWANLWKVPVSNVTYRFILPEQDAYYNRYVDYSLLLKPWEVGEGCTSGSQYLEASSGEQQVYVKCEQLDTSRSTTPDRPVFTWYLDNSDESPSYCGKECSSRGDFPYFLLGKIVLSAMIGLLLLALVKRKYSAYRRRRDAQDALNLRSIEASLPVPQEFNQLRRINRTSEPVKANILTKEEVNRLPVVQFGAADVEAAIDKYYQTYKIGADRKTKKDENAHTTNRLGQKVAFSACISCSICICDFKEKEQVRMIPNCGHAFHTDCIKQWLTEQKRCCPLCQEMIG